MTGSGRAYPPRGERYRCSAFGLTVESDWPLAGSAAAAPGAKDPTTVTRVRRLPSAVIDEVWRHSAERILEHRRDDGAVAFTVDHSPEHYRFRLEGFGRYLVSVDGTSIVCELGAADLDHLERFVLAHALPVAAVLRGYEVLHASAIATDGGAVAFAGASGAGKTHLATKLITRGGVFLTDDVLAVQASDDHVLAHPGPALMAIRHDDAALIAELGGRWGAALGATDKVHVSPPSRGTVSRLRVIYHLRWGDRFAITPLEPANINRVLALAFVPYLAAPERLVRHLRIAQLVSTDAAQFELQTPSSQVFNQMLATLEAHMRDASL